MISACKSKAAWREKSKLSVCSCAPLTGSDVLVRGLCLAHWSIYCGFCMRGVLPLENLVACCGASVGVASELTPKDHLIVGTGRRVVSTYCKEGVSERSYA